MCSFFSVVKLHSISIKGTGGAAPRHVRLFVNRISLGFSDVADAPPAQDLDLTAAELAGDPIALRQEPLPQKPRTIILDLFVERKVFLAPFYCQPVTWSIRVRLVAGM
jgi:PITH domain